MSGEDLLLAPNRKEQDIKMHKLNIKCTVIHNATQLHAYKIRGNPFCLPVFTGPLLLAISFLEIHLACQLQIGFSA